MIGSVGAFCLLSMWTRRGLLIGEAGFYEHLINEADEDQYITIKARSEAALTKLRDRLLEALNSER